MADASAKLSMITLNRYLRAGRIEGGLSVALEQVAFAVKRIANELAVAPEGRAGPERRNQRAGRRGRET